MNNNINCTKHLKVHLSIKKNSSFVVCQTGTLDVQASCVLCRYHTPRCDRVRNIYLQVLKLARSKQSCHSDQNDLSNNDYVVKSYFRIDKCLALAQCKIEHKAMTRKRSFPDWSSGHNVKTKVTKVSVALISDRARNWSLNCFRFQRNVVYMSNCACTILGKLIRRFLGEMKMWQGILLITCKGYVSYTKHNTREITLSLAFLCVRAVSPSQIVFFRKHFICGNLVSCRFFIRPIE